MPKFLSLLPFIALMALTAPAAAQDAAAEETPAEGAAGSSVEDQLAVGQEATELGSTYVKQESGDWELRCIRTETPENDPCQLYQLLKEENGNALAEISMFRLPAESKLPAGATVIVPLETLLTGQLGISVDGSKPKSYPFSFCNRQGCYARIGLTAEDIAAFKRGAEAKVMIRPFAAPDQIVASTMSLSGFTAGFELASVLQQ
ncbi:invasion associated locus B family protein [Marinovum sp. 2_MG-2023]|uniref:invasion associated locus B family protein n=1 Tax=unclassified Marinovum TaxID=2647166 RepID=UPI0026E11CC7|nr:MULTISPECIES: invasion associated locus B family protein [unclassified Marinovum]MDO6732231.1 invasion associated locus B family protein [Marinovum sp. 2_MG-2023]MDO6781549.1 invasion associated locus B family protein [Marinovum sp. 1_MG-2023]